MIKKKDQGVDVIPEYTLNSNGVRIKKCCSSCKHHQPKDEDHRLCMFTGEKKIVFMFELCDRWEISSQIDKIRTNGCGV